jgi:type IV pilus assembly protein PilO
MTLAGDLGTVGAEAEGKGGNQTNLFIGIGIGLLGLGIAGFLAYSQLLPAMQKNQELQAEVNDKQIQVKQEQELQNQLLAAQEDQDLAKQQSEEIQTLFADEASLDTLLLDINRILKERGVELIQFEPNTDGIQLVTDGSLGTDVDGKLRSRGYRLQFSGTFDQTRLVLLNIERLQPLLVVESMRVTVDPASQEVRYQGGNLVAQNTPKLTTEMEIKALLPADLPPPAPVEAAPEAAPEGG